MLITNADEVNQLVRQQLDSIEDDVVRDAIVALLVEPFVQYRRWFDDLEPETCWVVAVDPTNNICFMYSEEGFSPDVTWGMMFTSDLYMGMDSNWYRTLEEAFYDSWTGTPFPVWNVVNPKADDKARVIESSLTLDQAIDMIAKLNAEQGIDLQNRQYRPEPRTRRWWS